MRVINSLVKNLRNAAIYNPDVQVAPACILWTDKENQWEQIIPRLQNEIPELFVLGDYAPESRTGPAIWLRCVLAGTISEMTFDANSIPILYLPNVSRQDLRAVENCPELLKPLAELQYRGVIWSQVNAKDWTILAFLKSEQGGLGLDVAQDNETKNAMQLALYKLLDEEISLLKGKRLDKDYFNTLMTSGDSIRDLLQWIDQGENFQISLDKNSWKAFVSICESRLAFNPESEGVLAGANKLAIAEGAWQPIWERFCEAPRRYSNIPIRIRQCKPPALDVFDDREEKLKGFPQYNDEQEKALAKSLLELANVPEHVARKRLIELDKQHAYRREQIWAELGEAPLAIAIQHLALIAEITETNLTAGTLIDVQSRYEKQGWKADNATLEALEKINNQSNFQAVTTAIRTIYLPWIEESARYLQQIVSNEGYPFANISTTPEVSFNKGECILFVDGLRFDIANRLISLLKTKQFDVQTKSNWAALPSVTATGKVAVSPVFKSIVGTADSCNDFEPSVASTGQSLKGGYHFEKLLKEAGWQKLSQFDNGDSNGNAWCEFGNIDSEGHARGWKLAQHLNTLIEEISTRIESLLDAGWKKITVVTDHGWLLMPDKLPKVELANDLTESKWGRCAIVKNGAITEERFYPWFWNSIHHVALADGVSCYRRAEEYAHGGLSLQECLTLEISVTRENIRNINTQVDFVNVSWRGLRCTVTIEAATELYLDIRLEAGNPTSSIVANKKIFNDGKTSVVIENEDYQGRPAFLILLTNTNDVVATMPIVIGND
jgi:hypothetical protein